MTSTSWVWLGTFVAALIAAVAMLLSDSPYWALPLTAFAIGAAVSLVALLLEKRSGDRD